MSNLLDELNGILQEKQEKIIPENIKKDVQIFDIIGTLEESGAITQEEYDTAVTDMQTLLNGTSYPIVEGDKLVVNVANATVNGDTLVVEVAE